MSRRTFLLATLLAVLAVASGAGATCKCGDVDGCKVRTCTGFNPGDSCTPPLAGVCRIVKGNANDAVCCCRCRKPPPPPGSGKTVRNCADHYAWVLDEAKALPGALSSCDDAKLSKAAAAASKNASQKLDVAEQACEAGNTAKETKQATASTKPLVKFNTKLVKLKTKNKLKDGCPLQRYSGLLDTYKWDVMIPGAQGTTTTTTTIPPGSGRAVTLDFTEGPFAAHSVVCLSRIQGGCVNAAFIPNCSCTHLHLQIFIDKAGPFADPQTQTSNHCGHGCVSVAFGCGPDTLPTCP